MGPRLIQLRTFNWPRIGRASLVLAIGAVVLAAAIHAATAGRGGRSRTVSKPASAIERERLLGHSVPEASR